MTKVKKGDRIRLVEMGNDPCPIPPGSEGTVRSVTEFEGWAQVCVNWDSGRTLNLVVPPDRFDIIAGA
ncbi:DUF4314 domain-containing protein [Paraburkholderia sp. BR14320]|uniref:DUF4314 domain-containing protein n=1 Tax=unclassified Paraburkholderia TaxID=2615204 RepID=UPI0034CDAA8C